MMRDGCTPGTSGESMKMVTSTSQAGSKVQCLENFNSFVSDIKLTCNETFIELIITAGGENVAPVPIEDRIKGEIPFISNVMLIGDKRKFLSCLVTLKVVVYTLNNITTKVIRVSLIVCDGS